PLAKSPWSARRRGRAKSRAIEPQVGTGSFCESASSVAPDGIPFFPRRMMPPRACHLNEPRMARMPRIFEPNIRGIREIRGCLMALSQAVRESFAFESQRLLAAGIANADRNFPVQQIVEQLADDLGAPAFGQGGFLAAGGFIFVQLIGDQITDVVGSAHQAG